MHECKKYIYFNHFITNIWDKKKRLFNIYTIYLQSDKNK